MTDEQKITAAILGQFSGQKITRDQLAAAVDAMIARLNSDRIDEALDIVCGDGS